MFKGCQPIKDWEYYLISNRIVGSAGPSAFWGFPEHLSIFFSPRCLGNGFYC